MKFKLDENVHSDLLLLLSAEAHDACSVFTQGLSGSEDSRVWAACLREERALVTQDLDFADVLAYPPEGTQGIVVLRGRDTRPDTQLLLGRTLVARLREDTPVGRLWIVEPGRIRIHGPL